MKNLKISAAILLLGAFVVIYCSADRRPFYVIGHLVNSIDEIEEFLKKGANVLESDVQFFPNGSVKELYHGYICDCGRDCARSANLRDYLQRVRNITDPNIPGNYYNQLVMLEFDLKLSTSDNIRQSGREIAQHVLDYLWSENRDREQEIRVIIYFEKTDQKEVVLGFLDEFKLRGESSGLKDVGFDGGTGDMSEIEKTFSKLKVTKHIWLSDGTMNCVIPFYSPKRLRKAIDLRDSGTTFFSKVYQWTIDRKSDIHIALKLGVDGVITNKPDAVIQALQEPIFAKDFRLATIHDDHFTRYVKE